MDVEGPTGVGRTAVGMAALRAAEGLRPDRLFDDLYAAAFVAAAPLAVPAGAGAAEGDVGAAFALAGVIRTRFYDDYLTASVLADRRQVVLMAAGLDTRALRLAWPAGVVLYELHLPEMLRFMDEVLYAQNATARCRRVAIPVDLRGNWLSAIRAADFDPGAPTTWLIEGLLVYLTHQEAVELLTTIGDLSAPRSQLAAERQATRSDELRQQVQSLPAMPEFAQMWKGGPRRLAPAERVDDHTPRPDAGRDLVLPPSTSIARLRLRHRHPVRTKLSAAPPNARLVPAPSGTAAQIAVGPC